MPKEKKRKRAHDGSPPTNGVTLVNTSKPSAVFKPTGGRSHTLSVALSGSIIANAASHDQKTNLAGTIARALAVFCVDEVIIFDDEAHQANGSTGTSADKTNEYTAVSDPCHFLAHLLSYLETPPYLRKTLFPHNPNLRSAGTLPSLDMPHHLRASEWCDYREGVTTGNSAGSTEVDAGLGQKRVIRDVQIPEGTRVTLRLDRHSDEAEVLAPTCPRAEAGYYWGYTVRRCSTLSTVFTESPFNGGYDLSFGTSERGSRLTNDISNSIPSFSHMLVVFGGVTGLETAARNDHELESKGIDASNVGELFDHYINVLPGQGSRTIRTEEAVWLGLMRLRGVVENNALVG